MSCSVLDGGYYQTITQHAQLDAEEEELRHPKKPDRMKNEPPPTGPGGQYSTCPETSSPRPLSALLGWLLWWTIILVPVCRTGRVLAGTRQPKPQRQKIKMLTQ